MNTYKRLLGLLLATLIPLGLAASINKSIHIDKGARIEKDLSSVNGNITLEDDVMVKGECSTVNGSITLGRNCTVNALSTVNGSVDLGPQTRVSGEVKTVNGRITTASGSHIEQDVETVNGDIQAEGSEFGHNLEILNGVVSLSGCTVKGNLSLGNGKVHLGEKTTVHGDVLLGLEKSRSSKIVTNVLRLTGGATIKGTVVNLSPKTHHLVIWHDKGTPAPATSGEHIEVKTL